MKLYNKIYRKYSSHPPNLGIGDWGLGIGDWGLGIGDWGLGPIPNPQSPIPNPHFSSTKSMKPKIIKIQLHIIDINILFKQRNNVVINIIIHIFSDTIKIAFYR